MKDIELCVDIFKALGDNTRLKIVDNLLENAKNVSEIASCVNISQSATSHQLLILKLNGIVKKEKKGKEAYYSIDDDHIKIIVETVYHHVSHRKNG